MTDLDAAGGRDTNGDDYEQTPKGNLDVTGRYFLWTTNLGGNRLDAFLVQIPAERLSSSSSSQTSRPPTHNGAVGCMLMLLLAGAVAVGVCRWRTRLCSRFSLKRFTEGIGVAPAKHAEFTSRLSHLR